MNAAVIPESIAQLQLQLNEIRSTRPRGKRLPDSVWQAAVELAREHGVYSVAHHLRLDYAGLKKRLGGVFPRPQKTRKPTAESQASAVNRGTMGLKPRRPALQTTAGRSWSNAYSGRVEGERVNGI